MATHRHHIVPRFTGGTNDPANLTPPISIRLHAMFHLDRWRRVGDSRDYIAYRLLMGGISTAEARYLALSLRSRGRRPSPETRARMSTAQQRRAAEGRMPRKSAEARARQSAYRKAHPELFIAALATVPEANRRRAWTAESRAKLAVSHRRRFARMDDGERAYHGYISGNCKHGVGRTDLW